MHRNKWWIIAFLVAIHALAASALLLPVDLRWVPCAIGVYLALGLATNLGLHRLLSHRAFACSKWLEYTLVTVAMINGQGSPLLWVANHRRHHALSDRAGDPSSPKDSFWYGHIGWVYDDASTDPNDWKRYCKDLANDRYYHWLLRFRLVPMGVAILLAAITFGLAAVPFVYFLPTVLWMHSIYGISSFCHTRAFGTARFDNGDNSRNVWWLGVLVLGDGWHNNHHAYPSSARHGFAWYEVDLSGLVIQLLERLGLAWDVRRSPQGWAKQSARRRMSGSGSGPNANVV